MGTLAIDLIALALLLVLLAGGLPVAFALLVSGATGIVLVRGASPADAALGSAPYSSISVWTLVVIPMFILMGILAVNGALAQSMFMLAQRVLRRVPGGLGLAVVATSAGFAAVTGSSVAAVAAVGRVSIAELRRAGYNLKFAGGIIGATGTLGMLIPPSVALVLYGIISGESVGKMLIAGIVPGLLTAIGYASAVLIRAWRTPELAGRTRATQNETLLEPAALRATPDSDTAAPAERGAPRTIRPTAPDRAPDATAAMTAPAAETGSLLGSVPVLVLFLVVIGGVYAGWFTPTEAGSVGAVVALLFMVLHCARSGIGFLTRLRTALREAAETSSMIFALILGASVFSYFLVLSGAPSAVTQALVGLAVPAPVVVILLLACLIPLGMFLEGMSMLLIIVPLAYPVVTALGYSGIWFGVMVVKLIEVGLLTPPVGLNVFVLRGVAPDLSLTDAFKGIMAFLPIELAVLTLLFVFPGLVTWLPGLMG